MPGTFGRDMRAKFLSHPKNSNQPSKHVNQRVVIKVVFCTALLNNDFHF